MAEGMRVHRGAAENMAVGHYLSQSSGGRVKGGNIFNKPWNKGTVGDLEGAFLHLATSQIVFQTYPWVNDLLSL